MQLAGLADRKNNFLDKNCIQPKTMKDLIFTCFNMIMCCGQPVYFIFLNKCMFNDWLNLHRIVLGNYRSTCIQSAVYSYLIFSCRLYTMSRISLFMINWLEAKKRTHFTKGTWMINWIIIVETYVWKKRLAV